MICYKMEKLSCLTYFRTIVIFAAFLLSHHLSGQNVDFDLDNVKEDIRIETDRDLYFSAEEIYFSAAYFINQTQNTPVLSTIIYIELFNSATNSSVIQKKLKLTDFYSSGALTIPKNTETGNYILRAYTQYQRNFSVFNSSYHFLTIINPSDQESELIIQHKKDSIEIVPEGNILLDNTANLIVIKVPRYLTSVENKYYIVEGASNVVKKVIVSSEGFAQTEFKGRFFNRYKFLVVKSNGDSIVTNFPEIQKEGIQTQIECVENDIKYSIKTVGLDSEDKEKNYKIKLFGNDYNVLYEKDISFGGSAFETTIPKKSCRGKINYIVLFDSGDTIQQINSIFIQPQTYFADLKISNDKIYSRDTVKAKLLTDKNILDESPFVTISVSKHKTHKEDNNFNPELYTKNNLILIDYLENNNEVNSEFLKQIMTLFDKNLNRKFFEEKILDRKPPKLIYLPEIYDVTLSGIVRNKQTLLPVKDVNIYASVLFNNPQLHVCKSKDNGEFMFTLNNVYGNTDVFLCPEKTGNTEYEILVSNSFSNEFPEMGEMLSFLNLEDSVLVNELYRNAQINEHFRVKPEVPLSQKKSLRSFNIDNNKTTTSLADFISLKNMEELFTEIVPTVKFKKQNDKYSFAVFDVYGNVFSEEPLVLLDKVPIFDPTNIMKLDISLIEKIEVINSAYILGENTFKGVIMITTKTDNFAGVEFPESSIFIEYPTVEPQFNTNFFESVNHKSKLIPDFRTTLFWNPNVKLNSSEYNFSFVTSDNKGVYDVEIKGFTKKGETLYCKKQIVVN